MKRRPAKATPRRLSPRGEVVLVLHKISAAAVRRLQATGFAVARADARRRVTIPKALRERFDIQPGDKCNVQACDGCIYLTFLARGRAPAKKKRTP